MMYFAPYVIQTNSGTRIPVFIEPATQEDLDKTSDAHWQTDWNSEYLSSPSIEKFAIVGPNQETIGLGAYQVHNSQTYVTIVYAESAPDSNPTFRARSERIYQGVGKLLIAYGIKYSIDHGCRGVVVFEAKTDDLALHYERDYNAVRIPSLGEGIKRYMLADENAWNLFSQFLEEASE